MDKQWMFQSIICLMNKLQERYWLSVEFWLHCITCRLNQICP